MTAPATSLRLARPPGSLASLPGSVGSERTPMFCSRSQADRLVAVTSGAPTDDAYRLAGLTLPGLANAHSHAFQRALRGRTHAGEGSFWTWREQMYELATHARPRLLLRPLARRVRRDGAGGDHVRRRVPLPPPRARRHALRRPQRDGPRGARGGAGGGAALHAARRLLPPRRHRALPRPRRHRVGRARRPARRARAGAGRRRDPQRARGRPGRGARSSPSGPRGKPLHAHVSEQPKENEDTLAAHGMHADRAARRRRSARRELHRDPRHPPDRGGRGAARRAPRSACARRPSATSPTASARRAASPTRARRWPRAPTPTRSSTRSRRRARSSSTSGSPPAIRGAHRAADLLTAATAGGYAALGWPEGGRLEAGALADLDHVCRSTPCASRASTPSTRPRARCSPRPPPTSAT